MKQKPPKEPWFAVRRELNGRRRGFLTALSFSLPLLLWCVVSYTPFIWHPDVKLIVSADRQDVSTVYTAGDYVGKDYFPGFAAAIRAENAKILPGATAAPDAGAVRANKKILRHLAAIAVQNGFLEDNQRENDIAIYELWRQVATGERVLTRPALSEENLAVVKENWRVLSARSQVYDATRFPSEPLLKLIPQGRPANPVYLPAPHEVAQTGYRDWKQTPEPGKPAMKDRLLQSLRVIGFGFLLAALIGVPVGILCGAFDVFSKLIEPFVDFFRYMPAPAFSTLLVAVLAVHEAPKVALVFIGTFFQLVLVIAKTTRMLDRSLLEAAQTLGAKRPQLVTRVIVPGILPDLYNDLRILLGWAWTWLVIAEVVGVKSGLTEMIETQGQWRNFDRVYPVIILIGVIGFLTDQFLAWFRIHLFPWTAEDAERRSRSLIRRTARAIGRLFQPAPKQPVPLEEAKTS